MKKCRKMISFLLSIVLVCSSLHITTIYAQDTNEIHIQTYEDWVAFAKLSHIDGNTKNKTVYLDANIDFENKEFPSIAVFSGTFEGNNHSLNHVVVSGNGFSNGVFRFLDEGATIQNLQVNGLVKGGSKQDRLGGICGTNEGTIKNVTFDGTVSGYKNTGGIVGINMKNGTIYSTQMLGTTTGTYQTGGIVGKNIGVITECTNQGPVNTDNSWLNDSNSLSDIVDKMETTNITEFNSGLDIGGIAGLSSGLIASCINHGKVGYEHSGYNIGGIVGRQSGIVSSCENYGNISGRKDIGGIVGQMEPFIEMNDKESISKAMNDLHALVNKMLDDMEKSGDVLSSDMSTLQEYSNKVIDNADKISDSIDSFASDTIDSVNDLIDRVEYVLDKLPPIMDNIDDAFEAMEDVSDALSDLSKDLDIEEAMKKSGIYDETDFSRITVNSSVGGTIQVDSSEPASGVKVTISVYPSTGYELKETPKVIKSNGGLVEVIKDATSANKYSFIMPSENVRIEGLFVSQGILVGESNVGGTIAISQLSRTQSYRVNNEDIKKTYEFYVVTIAPSTNSHYILNHFQIGETSVDISRLDDAKHSNVYTLYINKQDHKLYSSYEINENGELKDPIEKSSNTPYEFVLPSSEHVVVKAKATFIQESVSDNLEMDVNGVVNSILGDDYKAKNIYYEMRPVATTGGSVLVSPASIYMEYDEDNEHNSKPDEYVELQNSNLPDNKGYYHVSEEEKITLSIVPSSSYKYKEDTLAVWYGSEKYCTVHASCDKNVITYDEENDVYTFMLQPDTVDDTVDEKAAFTHGYYVSAEFEVVPVLINSTTVGGNASYRILKDGNQTKVKFTLTPDSGYKVKNPIVENYVGGTKSTITNVQRLTNTTFEYQYTIPTTSDYTQIIIGFERSSSDYEAVQEAKSRLEVNIKTLSDSLTKMSTLEQDLLTYIPDNGDIGSISSEDRKQIISLTKELLTEISLANTLASICVNDLTTITKILGPYLEDTSSKASDDLDEMSQAMDDLSNSLQKANRKAEKIVNYLNALEDLEFSQMDESFENEMDDLISNLHGINSSIGTISDHVDYYSDIVIEDIRKINDQANYVMNLLFDRLEIIEDVEENGLYEDTSIENIYEVTSGKVTHAKNYGWIEGDVNIGGISGSMAIDDNDPEAGVAGDYVDTIGSRYTTKCVIMYSNNYGYVEVKRDGAGGITGYMHLGAITDSFAEGTITSLQGDYVGGIAGESSATIRNSYSLATLSGNDYVGGIVGKGDTIENCYAMPIILDSSGRMGAIAGQIYALETSEDSDYFKNVKNNYYVSEDIYGIDDISYIGIAEPLSYEELISRKEIPSEFSKLHITLLLDKKEVGNIPLEYNQELHDIILPEIEVDGEIYTTWPTIPTTKAVSNIYLTALENDLVTVLSSKETTSVNKPIALIEGIFTDKEELHATKSTLEFPAYLSKNNDNIEIIDVRLYYSNVTENDIIPIRLYNFGNNKAQIYHYNDGTWTKVEANALGSYMQLSMIGTNNTFAIVSSKIDNTPILIIGSVIMLGIMIVLYKVNKKRRIKRKQKSKKR